MSEVPIPCPKAPSERKKNISQPVEKPVAKNINPFKTGTPFETVGGREVQKPVKVLSKITTATESKGFGIIGISVTYDTIWCTECRGV